MSLVGMSLAELKAEAARLYGEKARFRNRSLLGKSDRWKLAGFDRRIVEIEAEIKTRKTK